MNYIIVGGSGFIGSHLAQMLVKECKTEHDAVIVLDIVMPGEQGVVPGIVKKVEGVQYIRCDVRKPIHIACPLTKDDVIFNLAAVHRTPGHADKEYFETNIRGAEHVVDFARENNISRILFTSSIAPYGAAEDHKTETTLPTPNTPYGISKLVAEKIHEAWQAAVPTRELTILRMGVVYGKGEHGNFTRLYSGIKNRYFFYPGRKDTIKACIYVKELVRLMKYRMIDHNFIGSDVINCTFEPAHTIEEICVQMQAAANLKRHIPMVPSWLLIPAAYVLGPIGGKKIGLHPARVKKLMISTNISGRKLKDSGYHFHFTLAETLKDWYEDCNCEGMF